MAAQVTDNAARHRFEMQEGEATAIIAYRQAGPGRIDMLHTEVPESLSGQGVGSRLVQGALDLARADGLKVVPSCSFVAAYIKRHPEYADLVAERG
ncbi:N-acetyltransferase [Roseomonas sp. SSH11]|uniref:N-acetyltransferase n=1 Tax=Pararoseomonas baculiformis TaxID=2820812 RepID=A0ABS4ABW7_9PROT|nr:GNAT family N-acetyltransferase [Pararoseomonas baculiformis]MBP0444493.1 N-acetyltransferase [Pararoseomonas baculiformis]